MTGPLYRLGHFCARHHRIVIAMWVVVAFGLALIGRAVGDRTSDNLTLPGTGSTKATDLLETKLPNQAYGSNPLVLQSTDGKLTDSKNKQAVDATVDQVRKTDHVIKAVNPLSDEGSAFLSKDKTIAYIPVTLDVGQSDITKDDAQAVLDAGDPARDAGMDVSLGSYAGQQLSKPSTHVSEAIGLAAAMVILLFAFGTATAMALPIVTAVLGLLSALSLIRLVGLLTDVPTVSPTLATMIGLGVGIDYALFIVTRHKLQLRDGMEMRESIARATATAGGAVVFAGVTVVIALCSLFFAGIPLVTKLGYTAAVAVVVAVTAATTLLPALLGALGPKIYSLRVHLGKTHPDDHQPHGWARWARGVAARPWLSLVAATAVLVVLALPVLNLHLGQSDVGALPESTTARQAYDGLTKGFGAGTNGPLLVSVELGKPAKPDQKNLNKIDQQEQQLKAQQQQIEQAALAQGATQQEAQQQAQQQTKSQSDELAQKKKEAESPATDPRLTDFENALKKAPDVKTVSPPTVDKRGDAAVYTVISKSAPSSDATEDLVNDLRSTTIPQATKGTDLTANVGGQTAGYVDLANRISDKLPMMILIVVGLSFIVLMLAFRSLVVPLKAAVMNLLSVAAAYGVVTWVFQEGHGASLIGLDHAIPIVSFVPLLMFAILFGLSMDYEVFLLTQIQEHYKEHGDPRRAVVEGLANTGRVITSAALIMVCVFTSFVANGDPVVKEFGVGLAVAIAIDATVVRCLLVPAVMTLLGKSSWWMPRWLAKYLPRISIEGEDYFADRPAVPAPAPPAPEPVASGR
jgi:putative drug exporter of the RND superfamily